MDHQHNHFSLRDYFIPSVCPAASRLCADIRIREIVKGSHGIGGSKRAPFAYRKSWARLIQKIYEGDPLICPKCLGTMRIISAIEDQEVIKTILKHLGL
jgi:hypothetical protein